MSAALRLDDIHLLIGATRVLRGVSLQVEADERWVVLGANGAGKTTVLRVAALYQHPSRGTVEVLGQRLGRCDVRVLRERIAFSSPAIAAALEPRMTATEAVMTAKHAALAPWWHRYDDADRARAVSLLDRFGCGALADLASAPEAAPVVLVTHHLEEIPPGFTHALVLRQGETIASGPLAETLTDAVLTECFRVALRVENTDGRFTARLA